MLSEEHQRILLEEETRHRLEARENEHQKKKAIDLQTKLVVDTFIGNPEITTEEIGRLLGIPTIIVQRILEKEKKNIKEQLQEINRRKKRDVVDARITLVVDTFIDNPGITIKEIFLLTGIPASTIQRDLNDIPNISRLYEEEELLSVLESIKLGLSNNYNSGKSKGGTAFARNNCPKKDSNGRFCGSEKRK